MDFINFTHTNSKSYIMKNILKLFFSALPLFLILSCVEEKKEDLIMQPIEFSTDKADFLYQFAYSCIDQEYPNKLGQVLINDSYLAPPRELHPAFYGCFDWHSAVHGHWTLVTILSHFPDFQDKDAIIKKLTANITEENIKTEIEFFQDEYNKTFQRTYGWAWLLKLDEALREWDNPVAAELHSYLKPLSDMLADKFIEFLDVLNYPIRVGEHPNTAFGMSFAYDYATKYHPLLAAKIEEKAREYFINDINCALSWEPGGFDFLSPCLVEASLMQKVLPVDEFRSWFDSFLPGFANNPEKYIQPAIVPDASDGKLAHLDGLNFSRAWCLFEIGMALENSKILNAGIEHYDFSYEQLDADEYMGSHWLASFAVYALLRSEEIN